MANILGMSMKITSTGGSIDFYDDDVVLLTDISGMGLDAEVVTTERACHNGSWYRYTKVPERNITIQATYRPLSFYEVVSKRRQIHDILKPGEKLDIYYNGGWNTYSLDGYAEKCEDTENGNLMVCSISIICPNPFFKGNEEAVDINGEATVNYSGTVPTGVVLEVNDADTVDFTINNETISVDSNLITKPQKRIITRPPIISVSKDIKTGSLTDDLKVNDSLDTSKIKIDTRRNEKGVYFGNSDVNCLQTIRGNGLYPELIPGQNKVSISSNNKPLFGKLKFIPLFGGV